MHELPVYDELEVDHPSVFDIHTHGLIDVQPPTLDFSSSLQNENTKPVINNFLMPIDGPVSDLSILKLYLLRDVFERKMDARRNGTLAIFIICKFNPCKCSSMPCHNTVP
ncbi:unnamed protein product [Didymodactylos carnosus]|uniref:Uncharacterized protein n=2 Tax=Didymodactylos carnosus TaxID=1234261 RepID=A0A814X1Y0_9BILA|nr:unnamed protein product [Didymodactylos carnosus]CAF3974206.1 unnamed protein product [Didymodactylos carnosus]